MDFRPLVDEWTKEEHGHAVLGHTLLLTIPPRSSPMRLSCSALPPACLLPPCPAILLLGCALSSVPPPQVSNELSFVHEAENLRRARSNMERAGIDVIVPQVVDGLVAEQTLVMSWEEGIRISDVAELASHEVPLLW